MSCTIDGMQVREKLASEAVWKTVLSEIEVSVSHASYVTWFKSTQLLSVAEDCAVVSVPNIFAKQQLEIKYNQTLRELLQKHGVSVQSITYQIGTEPKKAAADTLARQTLPRQPGTRQPAAAAVTLNKRYTFENFIVGSGNELAYAACQAIAANPGKKYNPLFIYGGVGLGKTHLIQAVGNGILEHSPETKIVYISTETFVNEFLDSIRFKKQGFADRYRSADVLIVDDIQFIAGKEKTQDEFFHTFNALHQANKQVILTSDKPPKAIPTLEDRLRSRFEWGMAIDIQPPDLETRQAILQAKAQSHNFIVPDDVVEYLAKHIQTNIRELEGSLNQLIAFCELRGIEPDIPTIQALLKGSRQRPRHVTPRLIIEKTAQHFDIKLSELTGPRRDKGIVVPRQLAMYLLRSELHLSFPKIAVELGRKDHTTAMHSVDKVEQLLSHDFITRQHIQEIREVVHG